MSETTGLSIGQMAAAAGVSIDTLRYYEKIGLLTRVARARSGHRRYGDEEVRWVQFLRKLHATGMPIRHMLKYARLMRRGESTVLERRALLEEHRADVLARIQDLQGNLAMIERKIGLYDRMLDPGRA